MYTKESFENRPFDFSPQSAQLQEMIKVVEKAGDPHDIFCRNIRYLFAKYKSNGARVADMAGHYHYIHLNTKSIYNVINKARRGISSVYACLLMNYFNDRFNACLSLSDMYTDLEQRDLFDNLKRE